MIAHDGRDGRLTNRVVRALRPACWALVMLALSLPAEAGPIRWVRTETGWSPQRTRPTFAPRFRPLARTLPLVAPSSVSGGPMASYFRWALRNQVRRVNVPPSLRGLRTSLDGRLPEWAFVDYLRWRRSLNPARFDVNHPNLARLFRFEPLPPLTPPTPVEPTVRPRTQQPLPPQVPEPSSALIAVALFGAGWWARRRRARDLDACR
jgi:hypothetical protein